MKKVLGVLHLVLFLRLSLSASSSDWILRYSSIGLAFGIAASIGLVFARRRHFTYLIAIVVAWMSLSNLGSRNVSLEFLLWVTLAYNFDGSNPWLKIPRTHFLNGLWFFFGFNYLFSGIEKLQNSHWLNGDALDIIMRSHAANLSVFSDALRAMPLAWLTYLVVLVEIFALPFGIATRTRKWTWLFLMSFHAVIAFTFHMKVISLTMLVLQLSLYEEQWWPKWHTLAQSFVELFKLRIPAGFRFWFE